MVPPRESNTAPLAALIAKSPRALTVPTSALTLR